MNNYDIKILFLTLPDFSSLIYYLIILSFIECFLCASIYTKDLVYKILLDVQNRLVK